jgi:hypothetical protein
LRKSEGKNCQKGFCSERRRPVGDLKRAGEDAGAPSKKPIAVSLLSSAFRHQILAFNGNGKRETENPHLLHIAFLSPVSE